MTQFGKHRKTTLALIGQVFGRLTVVGCDSPNRVTVRCTCGTVKEVAPFGLVRGRARSCGCLHRELMSLKPHRTTHGRAGTATYASWNKMHARCGNPRNHSYHTYGGRGITVCERWAHIENFVADMGERPEGMTLDRIDSDKGYSPDNCRWATPREQAQNTSRVRLLSLNGQTLCLAEWRRRLNIPCSRIERRLKRGWSVERALTVPSLRRPR